MTTESILNPLNHLIILRVYNLDTSTSTSTSTFTFFQTDSIIEISESRFPFCPTNFTFSSSGRCFLQ